MASIIVPETPDQLSSSRNVSKRHKTVRKLMSDVSGLTGDGLSDSETTLPDAVVRRRSSRSSTRRSSMALEATLHARYDQNATRTSKRMGLTFVEESPDVKLSQDETIVSRARRLGITTKPKPEIKVMKWLRDNSPKIQQNKKKPTRKSRRLSHMDMVDYMVNKEDHPAVAPVKDLIDVLSEGSESLSQLPATSSHEKSAQVVESKNPSQQSEPSSDEIRPGPPSFQDYSTESCRKAIANLEAGVEVGAADGNTNSACLSLSGQVSASSNEKNKTKVEGSSKNPSQQSEPNSDEIRPGPPSFQDYSTESCRKAITNLEAGVEVDTTEDGDNSLLPTQPSIEFTLDGVLAFVEVRSRYENRSGCVKKQLEKLGAKIADKLTSRCTHLVFKEGSLTTYNRAKKLGIHIVSATWVEECRKQRAHLNESQYPCVSKEKYDSPGLFPKLRKLKSMQPKTDEEFNRAIDIKVKRARQRKEKQNAMTAPPKLSQARAPLLQETPPKAGKSVLAEILHEYETAASSPAAAKSFVGDSSSPCTSEDLDTPFAQRIVRKMLKDNANSLPSSPLAVRRRISLEGDSGEDEFHGWEPDELVSKKKSTDSQPCSSSRTSVESRKRSRESSPANQVK